MSSFSALYLLITSILIIKISEFAHVVFKQTGNSETCQLACSLALVLSVMLYTQRNAHSNRSASTRLWWRGNASVFRQGLWLNWVMRMRRSRLVLTDMSQNERLCPKSEALPQFNEGGACNEGGVVREREREPTGCWMDMLGCRLLTAVTRWRIRWTW